VIRELREDGGTTYSRPQQPGSCTYSLYRLRRSEGGVRSFYHLSARHRPRSARARLLLIVGSVQDSKPPVVQIVVRASSLCTAGSAMNRTVRDTLAGWRINAARPRRARIKRSIPAVSLCALPRALPALGIRSLRSAAMAWPTTRTASWLCCGRSGHPAAGSRGKEKRHLTLTTHAPPARHRWRRAPPSRRIMMYVRRMHALLHAVAAICRRRRLR